MSFHAGRRSYVAPPPTAADVGLVAAMPMEMAPLIRQLANVRKYKSRAATIVEGELGDKLVVVATAGMGRARARRGVEALIDGHRPRWVLSAGFGGALDPALKRNDAVMATEIVDVDGGKFAIDVRVPDHASSASMRGGRLLTVDAVARTVDEKRELRRRYDADVVEMESAAVAEVCAARGVKMIGIRVISDEAGLDLPPEVATIMGNSGSFRLGAAVGALWRRPSSLTDLLALREHAHEAADRLAEVVRAVIAALP